MSRASKRVSVRTFEHHEEPIPIGAGGTRAHRSAAAKAAMPVSNPVETEPHLGLVEEKAKAWTPKDQANAASSKKQKAESKRQDAASAAQRVKDMAMEPSVPNITTLPQKLITHMYHIMSDSFTKREADEFAKFEPRVQLRKLLVILSGLWTQTDEAHRHAVHLQWHNGKLPEVKLMLVAMHQDQRDINVVAGREDRADKKQAARQRKKESKDKLAEEVLARKAEQATPKSKKRKVLPTEKPSPANQPEPLKRIHLLKEKESTHSDQDKPPETPRNRSAPTPSPSVRSQQDSPSNKKLKSRQSSVAESVPLSTPIALAGQNTEAIPIKKPAELLPNEVKTVDIRELMNESMIP